MVELQQPHCCRYSDCLLLAFIYLITINDDILHIKPSCRCESQESSLMQELAEAQHCNTHSATVDSKQCFLMQ